MPLPYVDEGVGDSLIGAVIRVMLVKHITDVTKLSWWRETIRHVIIVQVSVYTGVIVMHGVFILDQKVGGG